WTTGISVQVNDGNAQRSQITHLTATFSNAVDLPVGWESNFALNVGSTSVGLILTPLDGTANGDGSFSGVTQVLIQFAPTAGATYTLAAANPLNDTEALNDGAYTLTVSGTGLLDSFGQEVDGNQDGIAGGTLAYGFRRTFCDLTGNGVVDNADAVDYSMQRFGTFDPVNFWFFDYNGDGTLDGTDDGQFLNRYA